MIVIVLLFEGIGITTENYQTIQKKKHSTEHGLKTVHYYNIHLIAPAFRGSLAQMSPQKTTLGYKPFSPAYP